MGPHLVYFSSEQTFKRIFIIVRPSSSGMTDDGWQFRRAFVAVINYNKVRGLTTRRAINVRECPAPVKLESEAH